MLLKADKKMGYIMGLDDHDSNNLVEDPGGWK